MWFSELFSVSLSGIRQLRITTQDSGGASGELQKSFRDYRCPGKVHCPWRGQPPLSSFSPALSPTLRENAAFNKRIRHIAFAMRMWFLGYVGRIGVSSPTLWR